VLHRPFVTILAGGGSTLGGAGNSDCVVACAQQSLQYLLVHPIQVQCHHDRVCFVTVHTLHSGGTSRSLGVGRRIFFVQLNAVGRLLRTAYWLLLPGTLSVLLPKMSA
jgi:hypothetical protein